MAGFDWNTLYTVFKAKMGNSCTVGRYTVPKSPRYPYVDISLADNSGGNYDLENFENTQVPMIEINVYCNNYDDAKCLEISEKAKEIMLKRGFQCITGAVKTTNADPTIARWTARYRRKVGWNDTL